MVTLTQAVPCAGLESCKNMQQDTETDQLRETMPGESHHHRAEKQFSQPWDQRVKTPLLDAHNNQASYT